MNAESSEETKTKKPSKPVVSKRKRNAVSVRLKWTDEMLTEIFEFAKTSLQSGRQFEKPTAPDYYKKFLEQTKLCGSISVDKLTMYMKNVKRNYLSALEWRGKTGEGILQSDPITGVATIEGELIKRCKYFREMDELLGDKPQFNPPFVHHTDGNTSVLSDVSEEVPNSNLDRDGCLPATEPESNCGFDEDLTETEKKSEPLLVKKRPRKSPTKSAAAALESAMVSRMDCENKRLDWEKECESRNRMDAQQRMQEEVAFRQQQFDFERTKWYDEIELRRLNDERNFELEKLRIQKDAEIAKLRVEREFESQK